MDRFLTFTVQGIAIASVYAIAASGLVVTYTTSGIFNFAHGAQAMLGAFLGWKGALGILMLASIIGSVVGLAMLGWLRARGKAPAAPPADPASDPPEAIAGGGADDEEITLEGHYLPFGPYLAVGGLLYLFFGPELIALYFNILQSPAGTPLLP